VQDGYLLIIHNLEEKSKITMLNDVCYKEIWTRLQMGHKDALLNLYNQYYSPMMNYGLKLTGDKALTNDCITQILLRLWDIRKKLPSVENPRSYMLTCLRHELIAELKSVRLRGGKGIGFQRTREQAEPSYEEYLIQLQTNAALKEKLASAFKKLSKREIELLQLKYFDDLDYDEISLRCRITKRTAYNIIHAALKTLKKELVPRLPQHLPYPPQFNASPALVSLAKLALAFLFILH
jgi:RNA polymerase sigma factor (sigma-70 family)